MFFKKIMLTIRLTRVGKKKDPSFRVIVVESKRKVQTGNYLEMVGSYDARSDRVTLNGERIKHWIAQGATISDTLHNLLVSNKIIEGKKINVLPKKTVPKKDEPVAADVTPVAAVAAAEEVQDLPAQAGEVPVAEEVAVEAAAEASADAGSGGADGASA
jgi:small subunit ribosomal protein S16